MIKSSGFWTAFLPLIFLAACDSNSPGFYEDPLEIRGEVLENGRAPVPPMAVNIQAWPEAGSGINDSVTAVTDASGQYAAVLGPFPNRQVDSLHVRVTQSDCGAQLVTELRRDDLAESSGSLVLPALALSYRLPPGQFGVGAEMCGAIVTPTTTELIGDYARLALWIDDVSDSVRGRWRLNHSASTGDDYGYFSGSQEVGGLLLELRPTQPTPCTGLELDIPVGGDNGVTMDAASLTGDGTCYVPNTMVRFFEGAGLPELLPPLATGD